MARRAMPAMLLAAAALADAAGAHGVALYVLLAAVPVVASIALTVYGELLDGLTAPPQRVQAALWALVLVLLLFGTAERAPFLRQGDVPKAGVSSLAAALVALALEAALGARLVLRTEGRPGRQRTGSSSLRA